MKGRKSKLPGTKVATVVDNLTAALAQRVMGWHVAPDRFLLEGRSWIPSWRFQPLERLHDALRLLEASNASEYFIHKRRERGVSVRVELKGSFGEAYEESLPKAITFAVARAVGLDWDGGRSITQGEVTRR
jgi:hypothetical protein